MRVAWPHADYTDEFPGEMVANPKTLGLCTGTLGVSAVSLSSTLEQLWGNGAAAVRLGVLVGAFVDAEEASPDSDGTAASLSVSWNASQSLQAVEAVLKQFPEVLISMYMMIIHQCTDIS